jgi:hypothetical protein
MGVVSADEPAQLHDAKGDAAKGDNQPDLNPDLVRPCMAYDRLRLAQRACDEHDPPYAGELWAKKTLAYGQAKRDLEAEFERIRRVV